MELIYNLSLSSTGIGAIFMALWKGFRVGQARKKFGVSYPDMYSKDSKVRTIVQHTHSPISIISRT